MRWMDVDEIVHEAKGINHQEGRVMTSCGKQCMPESSFDASNYSRGRWMALEDAQLTCVGCLAS